MPDPKTLVLMTTWNRPDLLRRALTDVRREADWIGAELVIADDHSDDARTLSFLAAAAESGATVIRSPETRVSEVSPHHYCQRNNLFAFAWILEHRPDCELIVKVDDDIQLAPTAFQRMLEVRTRAITGGLDVAQTSGIQTIHEETVGRGDGFNLTMSACNACVIYEAADWRKIIEVVNEQPECLATFMNHGFDWFFTRWYIPNMRPHGKAIATRPSVCYHAGHKGLHTNGVDINVNYAGVP